jgi:hypothetical protein
MTHAQDYAQSIGDQLARVGVIVEEWGEHVTGAQLEDVIGRYEEWKDESGVWSLDDLRGAVELLTDMCLDSAEDDGQTVWDRYLSGAVELVAVGSRRLGYDCWNIDTVKIVVTVGGPDCWLSVDQRDRVTVHCVWGSDTATVRVICDGLSASAFGMIEGG